MKATNETPIRIAMKATASAIKATTQPVILSPLNETVQSSKN